MGLGQKLLEVLVRQTVGESGERLAGWLKQHFNDPTQALPKALEAAHSKAWHCIELALAEPSLSADLKRKLANAAIKALLQPLDGLLNTWSAPERSQALGELQQARTAGLLTLRLDAAQIAGFTRLDNTDALLAQAWELIATQSRPFNAYPKLHALLTYRTPQGPLLFLALSYFLRQAILADDTLREDLNLQQLRTLCQGQQQGFDKLKQLFEQQGAALAQAFTALAGRMEVRFDQLAALQQETLAHLQRLQAANGAIEPRLTHLITDPQERDLVRKLLERYRALPEVQRRQHPELLNQLGKLSVASGDLPEAAQLFAEAKTAESHYNRYRVLLEQHRWADALAALLQAAQLDPARFEPFPLRKYQITQLLGAGGFGVAFLCQDLHLAQPVVIKTLHTATLSRSIAEVFKEARALKALNDPRIVRLEHADYADTAQQRPYLVMEYFAGQALSDYLTQHGNLPADQALALAVALAQALQAAHGANILHRDLKPDNLLVRREANRWAIKLIDFGLAAKVQAVRETLVTHQAHLSLLGASLGGTYQFSAPEQFNPSLGSVGPYSDVYGYGKTLCYALFGTANPTFDEWEALGGQHVLTRLLNSCIRDDLKRRPQDFGAVLTALQGAPVVTAQPTPQPTTHDAELTRARQQRVAAEQRLQGLEAEEQQQRKAAEAEAQRQQQLETERQRLAEVERALQEREAAKQKAEAEQQRKREAAEAQRKAETEQQRKREAAEAQRKAETEQQRKAAETRERQKEAEAQRKVAWVLSLLLLAGAGVAGGLWWHRGDAQTPPASYHAPLTGLAFALIPAGCFQMGSPAGEADRQSDEGPQHQVCFKEPFYLSKTEVTQAAWEQVMGSNPSYFKGANLPVERVSWDDIQGFIRKLNAGGRQCFGLPTEAQWEYGARAGSTTAYFRGNSIGNNNANCNGCGSRWDKKETAPVGSFAANAFGLHDMHGNVWEWVQDRWHGDYSGAPPDGSAWETNGVDNSRVLRGGSWLGYPRFLRSARRFNDTPDARYSNGGFRLVVLPSC